MGNRAVPAETVRIALIGAGSIGRKHMAALARSGAARLAAIVDPSVPARALALALGLPHFDTTEAMLAADIADGAILATPTPLHFSGAMACIAARLPVLVEKPVTATPQDAWGVARAAEAAGVPVLVGHHRRHNPLIARAREIVQGGGIGRVIAVHATTWFFKPDAYFAPEWRRAPGAGPILTNLIHDVDLMRWIVGEVVAVQALASQTARGFGNEDTAAATLRFANGALCTVDVSDAAVSPWSWEMTSGENPDYPRTDEGCYRIAGSTGALDLPSLTRWRHAGAPDWFQPIQSDREAVSPADPLDRQIDHFAAVIRGEVAPLVGVRDAARSLAVVDAIARAAQSGATEYPEQDA